MSATSQSLVNDAHLITKVYFPRLILPISSVGSYLIDFLLATVVLLALMAFYGMYPDWQIVALPALAGVARSSALGVGTWSTALNVRYRDVRYAVPFIIQVWLFMSPVAYSSTAIPDIFRAIYNLNPMAGNDRGLPLGADRNAVDARLAARDLGGHGIRGARHRRRLLPAGRANLRRRDLSR